jgi:thiamine-phosphate pyrophosphorylase
MSAGVADTARLIVITDHQRWSATHIEQRIGEICRTAQANTVVIQLRDRELSDVERLRLGARLRELTTQHQQRFVVSERVDLAVLLSADGVALPEGGLPGHDAKSLLKDKGMATPWISCAWHDVQRLPDPEATVCVLSPIAETRKGRTALGIEQLKRFRQQLPAEQRLFALGGITADNAAAVLAAGAQGLAVMGAAFDSEPMRLLQAVGIAR